MSSVTLDSISLSLPAANGSVNILDAVNLQLEKGETVCVAGPSGSGKTTLIMLIAGLERPTSGRIEVDGQDLGVLSEDELARFRRGRIGVVFQGFHLLPTLTALENAALPLELDSAPDAREQARQRLVDVGLEHRLGHYPAQLSGGEQQRVALARAFASEPALLLADEPTGNLDAATGRRVMDLLFDWVAARGSTLLLITHDMELAKRCNRLLGMRDGRIGAFEPAGAPA